MQASMSIFQNAAAPLPGTTPSSPWKMTGSCLTANGVILYRSKPVSKALWFLDWDPNSAGSTFNAVRLIKADDGPSNIEQIAFVNSNKGGAPIVNMTDVTDIVNGMLAAMTDAVPYKQILMQTCGDTASKIYASRIDLFWAD